MYKQKKFTLMFLVFFICCFLSLSSCYYQLTEEKKDLENNPPIGKIVKVENINYHINCTGTGSPVVILEAGLGENSLSWYLVQEKISKITKVCSYDRAGLGWSDGIDKEMSEKEVAITLNKILKNSNVSSPFIFVAHSRGGIFARNYYNLFKNDVKGMILVDSTGENNPYRMLKYAEWDFFKQKIMISVAVPLSELGFIRFMGWSNQKIPSFPDNILKTKNSLQNRTETAKAIVNEIKVMRKGLEKTNIKPISLDDLPLIVISSGKKVDLELVKKNAIEKNKSVKNEIELALLEKTFQKELTFLSSNSEQIIAKNSGHMIMYDEPELIITSIIKMLNSFDKKDIKIND